MRKERGNSEIKLALEAWGCGAEKNVDGPWYSGGKPDYTVYTPNGKTLYVEGKFAARSFKLSQISAEQGAWLTFGPNAEPDQDIMTCIEQQLPDIELPWAEKCWLWLWTGEHIRSRLFPRKAYLVPWQEWLTIEVKLRGYGMKSLPCYTEPRKKRLRNKGLVATAILKPYELEWEGGRKWGLPPGHPFEKLVNS